MVIWLWASLCLGAPNGGWWARDTKRRADWIAAHDEAAQAWVADEGRLTEVAAWMAAHRQSRVPKPWLMDRRGGAALWMVSEHLGEELDDPRLGEWASHVFVQQPGEPSPGTRVDVGDPLHSLCVSGVSYDGAHVWVGRLQPLEPGDDLRKDRTCSVSRIDVATLVQEPIADLDTLRLYPTTEGEAWATKNHVLLHITADGEVTSRRRAPRSVAWHDELGLVSWSRRGLWVGDPFRGERIYRGEIDGGLIDVVGDELWMHTSKRANGGEVVRFTGDEDAPEQWRSLVAERPGSDLMTAVTHGDRLYAVWSRDGMNHLEVQPRDGGPAQPIDLDGPWVNVSVRRSWSEEALVTASSPLGVAVWALQTNADGPHLELLSDSRDPELVLRSIVVEHEGISVPVTLMHHVGTEPNGTGTLWLDVYGGFGLTQRMGGGDARALFMAAGGTVGLIHAHGGRERGEAWHTDAMQENLSRTIDDVDAAVAGLIEAGWAAPGRVALRGSSNGGLTVAASLVRSPERYGAVVVHAGVLDMIRGPKWGKYWWNEEYGRPKGDQRAVLQELSPKHHAPTQIPPTLVITGAVDPVVSPNHSYALVASWEQASGGPLLLRVDGFGSHGGSKKLANQTMRSEPRAADAATVAFVLRALDLAVPSPPEPDEATDAPTELSSPAPTE